jgi:CheY-like chemotaxis protein
LLEPTNVKIDCAENGLEAVKMFQETPDYDMVLMDLQMPIMDGYEATKQIRSLSFPKAKTVQIIAMTANVFRDDIERCQEAGMNNHIGKPLDFEEVVEKMLVYMPAA